VWLTGLFKMAFLGVVTVLFVTLAPWLISIFTDEIATAAVGVSALSILSYGYIIYAWAMVMAQAFNGAGDTMTPNCGPGSALKHRGGPSGGSAGRIAEFVSFSRVRLKSKTG
jgi:hypothetical protein